MIDINAEYGTASPGVRALSLEQLSDARTGLGIEISLVRHRAAVRVGRELGNDWLFDQLSGATGLFPIATVTTVGIDGLAGELTRAVKRGARGLWIEPPDPWSRASESVHAALS